MAKLKAQKTRSADTNGFDETLEYKVLMCTNFNGNNNKFYSIELQKNANNEHRIFTHYGRLGLTNQYDIRDNDNGSPLEYDIAKKNFDLLVKEKQRGKKKDGYIEKYETVDTFSPTVGSSNIKNKVPDNIQVETKKEDIKLAFIKTTPKIQQLINQICEENIHNITSALDIKLTNNGFETALGPVTKAHVEKATQPLSILKTIIEKESSYSCGLEELSLVRELNTEFYSLIPHRFGHKITTSDLILTTEELTSKFDLLDMLSSAVEMGNSLMSDADERYHALGAEITELKDVIEIDRIHQYLENSKADNHRHSNVWRLTPKTIYSIKLPFERDRFIKDGYSIGNVQELFHGSRNCNVLSILKNGLMVFKEHPKKAGDMFGPGIYFANNSTKSANYSIGYWGGVSNKFSNNFLFLADIALGNIKEEKYGSKYYLEPPQGYHSVKGCKGSHLYNDEFIVYDPKQVTLKYLVEFNI